MGSGGWNRGLTSKTDNRILGGKNHPMYGADRSGENAPMLGRHHSKKSKEFMSLHMKGRIPWNKDLTKETSEGMKRVSEARKGCDVWITGLTKKTDLRVKAISDRFKGRLPWNTGLRKENDERVRRISEKNKGSISPRRGVHLSRETLLKIIKSTNKQPNKKELKLNSILQNLFPNEYALNVKANIMTLGGKIPDFVNMNGQKKIIEFYGDYWHSPKRVKKYVRTERGRIVYFKKFGWKCLIVWQHELKDPMKLEKKLINFNRK